MSKKLNGFGTKIQLMFQQVNSTIRQMLSNLSYIYQSHGIKYQVEDKYDFIIRVLTPFEIMSYFHITPIEGLVDPKQISFWKAREKGSLRRQTEVVKHEEPQLEEESLAAKIRPSGGYKFTNFKNYLDRETEKKLDLDEKQDDEILKRIQMAKEVKVIPTKARPYVHKGILTLDQQKKIFKWIQFNYEQGHQVSKSDTIKQARILSEGRVGSTGWARGFFARNPQLLPYIRRAKPTERSQITFMNRVDNPFKKVQGLDDSQIVQWQKKQTMNQDQNDEQIKYYEGELLDSEQYKSSVADHTKMENFQDEGVYDEDDSDEDS